MRFRDGLIVARGQILWILLLTLGSVAVLRLEDIPPDIPPATAPAAVSD